MWLLALIINQGAGDVEWIRLYGSDDYDWAEAVAVDSSGMYMVVGATWMRGNFDPDVWMLKLDSSSGDTLWTLIYGDSGVFEWPGDVLVDSGGNYLIAVHGDSGIIAIKVDAAGNVIWSRNIAGGSYVEAIGAGLGDGGEYYIGATYGDSFKLFALDLLTGDVMWSRNYEAPGYLSLRTFASRSGICAFGGALHNADFDLFLYIVDCNSGDSLFSVVMDVGGQDFVEDVSMDDEGNIVLAGGIGYVDSSRLFVAKVDENGNPIWLRKYGSGFSWGNGIDVSPMGYCVVAGSSGENGSDYWMLKVEPSSGDTLWSVIVGDTAYQEAIDVAADREGGYVMVGETDERGIRDLGAVKVMGEIVRQREEPVRMVISNSGGGWFLQNIHGYSTEVRIFDIRGRLVKSFLLSPGEERIFKPPYRGLFFARWKGGGTVLMGY